MVAAIVARSAPQFGMLIEMAVEELRADWVVNDVVVTRLMEVVFIEALRSAGAKEAAGVLGGLSAVHDRTTAPWNVPSLARVAVMSRSFFFNRFRRTVGVSPMNYLLHWRMALAKRMLDDGAAPVAAIPERAGYALTATFSTAFSRHVSTSPRAYAKRLAA